MTDVTPTEAIAAYDALLVRAHRIVARPGMMVVRLSIEGETATLQYWEDEGVYCEHFPAAPLFLPDGEFAEWLKRKP